MKLLVLLLIVGGVWYGFKAVARRNKAKQLAAHRKAQESVEDMSPCAVCGAYVTRDQSDCGKDGCPYMG